MPGQKYVATGVPTPNDAIADCPDTACPYPGGTITKGSTDYVQIFWNGRFGFVRAEDVS